MDTEAPILPNLAGRVFFVIASLSVVILMGQFIQDHFRVEGNLKTERIFSYQQQLESAGQLMNGIFALQQADNDVAQGNTTKQLKLNFQSLKSTQITIDTLSKEILALNKDDDMLTAEGVVNRYAERLVIKTNELLALLESNSEITHQFYDETISLYYPYQNETRRLIEYLFDNVIEKNQHHRQMMWWITAIVIVLTLFIGIGFYRLSKRRVHQQFNALSELQSKLKLEHDQRELQQQQLIKQSEISVAEHLKLESILNSTVDAIITITAKGIVDSFNKAAERMFGYPAEAVVGQNIKILMPEPHHSKHDGYLKKHHDTGEEMMIGRGRELIGKRVDGSEFPIFLSVNDVEGSVPKLFTGIIQDVTKWKKSDAKLHQALQELTQKQQELAAEEEIARHVFENITASNNAALPELSSWCEPMGTFSGDMMLSSLLPSGAMRVILCDFTGHGLPAALGAVPVSSIHSAMAQKGLPLEILMEELNNKLKELLPTGIFCCIAGVDLDPTRSYARVWNAGLPDVIFVSQSGEIKQKIKSTHLPLGVVTYRKEEMHCEDLYFDKGDMLYIFSDGITEAENQAGEMLGQDAFEQLLLTETDEGGRMINIKNSVSKFMNGTALTDDLSLIEVKTLVTRDEITLES